LSGRPPTPRARWCHRSDRLLPSRFTRIAAKVGEQAR
jgi:hypothetical protein